MSFSINSNSTNVPSVPVQISVGPTLPPVSVGPTPQGGGSGGSTDTDVDVNPTTPAKLQRKLSRLQHQYQELQNNLNRLVDKKTVVDSELAADITLDAQLESQIATAIGKTRAKLQKQDAKIDEKIEDLTEEDQELAAREAKVQARLDEVGEDIAEVQALLGDPEEIQEELARVTDAALTSLQQQLVNNANPSGSVVMPPTSVGLGGLGGLGGLPTEETGEPPYSGPAQVPDPAVMAQANALMATVTDSASAQAVVYQLQALMI